MHRVAQTRSHRSHDVSQKRAAIIALARREIAVGQREVVNEYACGLETEDLDQRPSVLGQQA